MCIFIRQKYFPNKLVQFFSEIRPKAKTVTTIDFSSLNNYFSVDFLWNILY